MPGRYWIGIGDIHESIDNVTRIPGIKDAAGVIIHGDITNRGDFDRAAELLKTVKDQNPIIYAQFGNMDKKGVDKFLTEKGYNIHRRGLDLGNGVGLFGVGGSTPTPFGTPSEFSDGDLAKWVMQAYNQVKHLPRLIMVAHTPPFDTTTDLVMTGDHVGSRSVRMFIEKFNPDVCLTGHIHESRGTDRIGDTVIVNPGMIAGGGYAVIRFDGERLSAELKRL